MDIWIRDFNRGFKGNILMKWIDVRDMLPIETGPEYSYMISDGNEIGIGYYEPEYFAEDPSESLQYSSEMWYSDVDYVNASDIKFWSLMPNLPFQSGF